MKEIGEKKTKRKSAKTVKKERLTKTLMAAMEVAKSSTKTKLTEHYVGLPDRDYRRLWLLPVANIKSYNDYAKMRKRPLIDHNSNRQHWPKEMVKDASINPFRGESGACAVVLAGDLTMGDREAIREALKTVEGVEFAVGFDKAGREIFLLDKDYIKLSATIK